MKDFDSLLAQAAADYVSSDPEKAEDHAYSEAAQSRLRAILNGKTEEGKERSMKKRLTKKMTAVLIAAAVLLTAGVVCAATPAIREALNLRFLREDSAGPLTEVPDGWIGVYTAEDLDAVRNDLHGKYILMNDIVLTEADYAAGGIFEGGFEPIGDGTNPFYGTFNGNGHIISGLCVTNSRMGDWSYALYGGLFGCARRYYSFDPIIEYSNEVELDIDVNGNGILEENALVQTSNDRENREISGGLIKNLGLTDGTVVVTYGEDTLTDLNGNGEYEYPNQIAVGAVAGWADYVVGCWTEDFTVEFTADGMIPLIPYYDPTTKWCTVGGIVGGCNMMDSCWSNAEIIVNAEAEDNAAVRIAGLAGMADSCVTSYFDGTVECGSLPTGGAVNLKAETVPIVLTETILEDIMVRLDAAEGDDKWTEMADGTMHKWNACKFAAFYCSTDYITYDFTVQDFTTAESEEKLVLLDPESKPREIRVLISLIDLAFPDGDFREYCIENGVKFDSYYTYDLRDEPECAFEGFDFDSIWTWNAENRPVLRLFAEAQKADAQRPRLGWQKGLFQAKMP